MNRVNLILGTSGIIVFFLLLSLAQEVNRQWQVQREIQELQSKLHTEQSNITQLENLNQYFQTDDFQERLAREKLNYRAPGEQVVLIPETQLRESETESGLPQKDGEQVSTPRQWWDTFFGEK